MPRGARLVRRKPFLERLQATLNPGDFLLWLSEELETRDWDSNAVGTQLGLGINFAFLLARANSGTRTSGDDIFRDDNGPGWLSLFIFPLVWGLVILSCANAFYAATRSRKYRLFEANVEEKPSTPSARRVKIQSTPGSASPLRFIADLVAPETASSRAHPDKATDVWELSVWDPLPVSIRVVCFFSPGHVLVYLMTLPLAPLDPRPSVTVFNALLIQVILSAQLILLSSLYTQQAKDQAIVQKEVMHEYDTKFVHPRVHPVVRDVGTQISEDQSQELVQVGTPTTLIRKSFHTRQNPHAGSEGTTPLQRNVMSPQMFTPPNVTRRMDPFSSVQTSRPSSSRKSMPASYSSAGTATGETPQMPANSTNFGGNMGVYTHSLSPLKKATSLNDINAPEQHSPRNSREMASYEQQQRQHRRQSSPVKSIDEIGSPRPNPFAPAVRHRSQFERFPSRR